MKTPFCSLYVVERPCGNSIMHTSFRTLGCTLVKRSLLHVKIVKILEGSRVNYSMVVQRDCPKRKNIFKPCDLNI